MGDTLTDKIFNCRQCGHCCHGETTVSLDEEDVARMVAYLRLPFEEVSRKYLRNTNGVIQMKIVDGHCIFYRDGCTIHTGKPWRCTEWPLHPSILADEANYSAIRESCRGITRNMAYREFCEILSEIIADGKKAKC
ncbi:MAG: YkgJ family cysteine cluster protein [Proteobacteria bacterium]|nr:YkgJ family cysteine cluster protein [Pseudomonadota bacterium]MBU1739867.1 YkgJ family cysteine cluster protein [Pseudomonadota bacterium]